MLSGSHTHRIYMMYNVGWHMDGSFRETLWMTEVSVFIDIDQCWWINRSETDSGDNMTVTTAADTSSANQISPTCLSRWARNHCSCLCFNICQRETRSLGHFPDVCVETEPGVSVPEPNPIRNTWRHETKNWTFKFQNQEAELSWDVTTLKRDDISCRGETLSHDISSRRASRTSARLRQF